MEERIPLKIGRLPGGIRYRAYKQMTKVKQKDDRRVLGDGAAVCEQKEKRLNPERIQPWDSKARFLVSYHCRRTSSEQKAGPMAARML